MLMLNLANEVYLMAYDEGFVTSRRRMLASGGSKDGALSSEGGDGDMPTGTGSAYSLRRHRSTPRGTKRMALGLGCSDVLVGQPLAPGSTAGALKTVLLAHNEDEAVDIEGYTYLLLGQTVGAAGCLACAGRAWVYMQVPFQGRRGPDKHVAARCGRLVGGESCLPTHLASHAACCPDPPGPPACLRWWYRTALSGPPTPMPAACPPWPLA